MISTSDINDNNRQSAVNDHCISIDAEKTNDIAGSSDQNLKSKRSATDEPENAKDPKLRKTHFKFEADLPIKQEERADCANEAETNDHQGTLPIPEIMPSDQHAHASSMGLPIPLVAIDNDQTIMTLLTEQQQQQLLQSYAPVNSPDLAHLTASSLAQAMISPIAVPALTTGLLQQLQNNVITALPGPPPMPHQPAPLPSPDDETRDMFGNHAFVARNVSNDERRQRRLQRNRVAAKECRKKKKQYIQEMEEKIARLIEENKQLHKQAEELKNKLMLGSVKLGTESYRLMKEIEELNAKLGDVSSSPAAAALTTSITGQQQPPNSTPNTTSKPILQKSTASLVSQRSTPAHPPPEPKEATTENSENQDPLLL